MTLRNRTPRERIEDEIELGIAKAFPRLLLDMELERHTRQGTRPDCDCEYCAHKKGVWWRFHLNGGLIQRGIAELNANGLDSVSPPRTVYGACGADYDDKWWIKAVVRESIRKTVRRELFEIRNKCE